jgi:hypothetical protein
MKIVIPKKQTKKIRKEALVLESDEKVEALGEPEPELEEELEEPNPAEESESESEEED